MSEQVFISYRRDGGDVYAKLICEALKNKGYTVFYDFDSIHGGYFDNRILSAIEKCEDFILVLPPHALDRCANEDDWVRLEIRCALRYNKNIIPVILPDFTFPKDLPNDIAEISRYNGVRFVIEYFDDAVIPKIIDRMRLLQTDNEKFYVSKNDSITKSKSKTSVGLEFTFVISDECCDVSVKNGSCTDKNVFIPNTYEGKPVTIIEENAFKDCTSIKKMV